MAADYPTSIKSFSTKVDNVDLVMAADINDIQTEITAIETQLVTSKLNTLAAAPVGDQVLTSVAGVPTWADIGVWADWTPTLSVAGGTAPIYATFVNRYCQVGKVVHVYGKWYNDSGGTAGAGSEQIVITLPITAYQENIQTGSCGLRNGATSLGGIGILLSETTFSLLKSDWSFVQGVDQNNTDRILTFTFTYEAA
jgi:hypothetical protein